MEPSKHFDEHIKRAMENLQPDGSGAWDLFEQKLEQAEMTEADDLFRQRLGQFEVPAVPGGWEAMEQLIEADEADEAAEVIEQEAGLDNLVQEKLSNLEVPFQNKHWAIMARRLEAEFALRKQIYRHKIAEVALVALILLTFVRFMPVAEELYQPVADVNSQMKVEQPNEPPTSQGQSGNSIVNEESAGQSEVLNSPITSNEVKTKTSGESLLNESVDASDIESSDEPQLASTLDEVSAVSNLKEVSQGPLSSIYHVQSPIDRFVERANRQQSLLMAQMGNSPEALAILSPNRLDTDFDWEEMPALATAPFLKKKQLRFSIFTTTDINYVTTPPDQLSVFDTTVATSAHATLGAGYGGGILVSWKKDKTEFQTGGIYSFKRYMPNTPTFLFKTLNYYVKEDFNGIQLDILQVPFNVNYHMKDRGNWRFYGAAGVAGNFVTTSVYEIEKEETEIFNDPFSAPAGPDDFRSIRHEKEFPDGLADGGSLRDNLYFSVNFGLGVERYVSPKWVVFFQPNYQHFIFTDGVGTNRDKIYTTSFHLGTKFSLK